jgi:hypothetical protein
MQQSEAGDFVEGRSAIMPEASLQVSCIWCGRLHHVERPLEFHPVCPTCTRTYPMGLLEMNGSYPLSHEAIDEMVSRTSPGNYALGYMDGSTFIVFYVGRSDSDVKRRLHEWVGAPSRYERYAPCAKAAWGSRPRRYRPHGAPMLDRVGIGVDSSYTCFAYSYARSAEAAFEKEWRNYYDFGGSDGLDNEADPVSTPG